MADPASRRPGPPGVRLAGPLRQYLHGGLNEAATRRVWHGIENRLPRERATRVFSERWAAALALLLIGSSLLGGWRLGWFQASRAPDALVLAQGGSFDSVEGASGKPRGVTLSDGSRIEVNAGARVEALSSTPTELSLVVRRGMARFSVTPGGPRRWNIEARGVRVEVVGTVLSVAAGDRSVAVDVEVGAVVVRSPLLADGVERLVAGQRLELPAVEAGTPVIGQTSAPLGAARPEAPEVAPPEAAPLVPPLEATPPGAAPTADALPSAAAESSAKTRAPTAARPRSDVQKTPAPRQRSGTSSEAHPAAARQLWMRADAARAAGESKLAAQLLEQLLREHPDDPRVSLAAFTLGTVLDAEREPVRAARAYRRSLDLGLPSVLHDTCFARLGAALYASGDVAGVRALAAEYQGAHPHGEQRSALDELARRAAETAAPVGGR
jgi:transmembrane sensor